MNQLLKWHAFLSCACFCCFLGKGYSGEGGHSPTVGDLSGVVSGRSHALESLDSLIEVTKENLESQRKLRGFVQEYLKLHEQYMKNTEDREKAFKMVKAAHRVLEKIKENHLVHVFDPEFISELTMFSQIATKQAVPRPS